MPAKSQSRVDPLDARTALRTDTSFLTGDLSVLRKLSAGTDATDFRHEAKLLLDEAQSPQADPLLLTRAGIAAYLTGRHQAADTLFGRCGNIPAAAYYRGLVLLSLGRVDDAEQAFEAAESAGFDRAEAVLKRAEAVRRQGQLDEAERIVRAMGKYAAGRAEYSFQMGCILADRSDMHGALEYFERAADIDPRHSATLFQLGNIAAGRGDESDAIRFYERALATPPFFLGAMLNLGLLYEDVEQYRAAAYCFRRVLDVEPNHARARLYLRDIEATDTMYYDEHLAKDNAKRAQLLSRPLSEFELSVRSRNCLQVMDLKTLGDLTRISEPELLAGKNFGETSLEELRDLLASQGLQIGESLNGGRRLAESPRLEPLHDPQEQERLGQPISQLQLSVRARKCMSRLGITTIGELLARTPDELLGSRNFGVTSLNEVRASLAEQNLRLRND